MVAVSADLLKSEPIGAARYIPEPAVLIEGNAVSLLRDGREAYPAMWKAIDEARRYIHLETFNFADDQTGHRFAKHLAAAAAPSH